MARRNRERPNRNAAAKNGKVIIGSPDQPARSTFMFLNDLTENDQGDLTCRSGILVSKKDKNGIKKILAAIDYAAKNVLGKSIRPGGRYHYPLVDGDELYEDEDQAIGEEGIDHYLINATAWKLPPVGRYEDGEVIKVVDPSERQSLLNSGWRYAFSVEFKGFSGTKKKGVRCELKSVFFIKEDEMLDGSKAVEEEFAHFADEMDDYDDPDYDDNDEGDEEDKPRGKRNRGGRSRERSRRSSSRRRR